MQKSSSIPELVCSKKTNNNKFTLQLTNIGIEIIRENEMKTFIPHKNVVEAEYLAHQDKDIKKFLLKIEASKDLDDPYLKLDDKVKIKTVQFNDTNDLKIFENAYEDIKMSTFDNTREITGIICIMQRSKEKIKHSFAINSKELVFTPISNPNFIPFKIEIDSFEGFDIIDTMQCKLKYKAKQSTVIQFNTEEDFNEFRYKHVATITKLDQEKYEKHKNALPKEPMDLDKFKIILLGNNPDLKKLYSELVIKGLMTEEDFWSTRNEIKEYEKYMLEEKQKIGKSSSLLFVQKVIGGEKILPKISDEEIDRLLRQYPNLKEFYLQEVGEIDNKEKIYKFWDEFIRKQKEKDTEIVGGKNPLYIWKQIPDLKKNQGMMEVEVSSEKIDLGDADLYKNLDIKLDLVEKSMNQVQNDQNNEKSIEKAIKRFQNHALSVLGGLKPSDTKKPQKEIDDEEFTTLIERRDSYGSTSGSTGKKIPNMSPLNVKNISTGISMEPGPHYSDHSRTNQLIMDNMINSNYNKFKQSFEEYMHRNDLREKRKQDLLSATPVDIFKDLFEASSSRKYDIPINNWSKYKEYNDRANTIMRLFYALILNENFTLDQGNIKKLEKMSDLINELKGEIKYHCENSLTSEERNKEFGKILNIIQEPLNYALQHKKLIDTYHNGYEK